MFLLHKMILAVGLGKYRFSNSISRYYIKQNLILCLIDLVSILFESYSRLKIELIFYLSVHD